MKKSLEEAAELLQLANLPIFDLSLDGKLQGFNEAAAEILGFCEDSVGREVRDLLPEAEALNEAVKVAGALESAEPRAVPGLVELRVKACEGRPAASLLLKLLLRLKDGAKFLTALGQDLCEVGQKAVEEKRKALNTIVSQEVRTPLHGMVGLATAMEKTAATSGAKKQLGMIRSCASRLLDVVTNALELSEGEQRKEWSAASAAGEKVSFAAVAEEVVAMTRLAVDKANKPLLKPGVELKNLLTDQEQIPEVLGKTSQCTQLLYNLVVNACKFTFNGSVSVSWAHLAEANELEIRVTDTGPGIPPEAMDKIFRPLEQERIARSASSQGLGLGLAVCKAIAESHKGRLSVESQVGKGSSFIVTLPCAGDLCDRVEEVITPRLAEAAGLEGAPSEASGPAPLLLAIADEEAQRALASALERAAPRCELVRCATAEAVMDWLKDKVALPLPSSTAVARPAPAHGQTSDAEVLALKQELARYRSKQQYVLERLKMQMRFDATAQSQAAFPGSGSQPK